MVLLPRGTLPTSMRTTRPTAQLGARGAAAVCCAVLRGVALASCWFRDLKDGLDLLVLYRAITAEECC